MHELVLQFHGVLAFMEMWIPIAAVVIFGRDKRTFFVSFVLAAGALVALRAILIPDYTVRLALAAVATLFVLSGAIVCLRFYAWPITRRLSHHIPLAAFARVGIVLVVIWLGFVAWTVTKWEIRDEIHSSRCFEDRIKDKTKGNPFECYVLSPDRYFAAVIVGNPIEYFAARHTALALTPGLVLIWLAASWILGGFRSARPASEAVNLSSDKLSAGPR